jgi:hypothetical protein
MANNQVITSNVNISENNGGKHPSSTSPTMQSPFQNVNKTNGIIYSKNMAQNVTVRINTDNLIGEEKMLNQRKAFGRLAQRYTTNDHDRLFLEIDFNDTVKILRDKGITITDNFKVYLYYLKKLADRASIELTRLPYIETDIEMKATNEELLSKHVFPKLVKKTGVTHNPPTGAVRPKRKAPPIPADVKAYNLKALPTKERPIPKPRTKILKEKPIPKPRTKIPKEASTPESVEKPKVQTVAQRFLKQKEEQQVVILKRPTYKVIKTALNRTTKTYKIQVVTQDPQLQLTASYPSVEAILLKNLNERKGLKYQLTLSVIFEKEKEDGQVEECPYTSNHISSTVTNREDLEGQIKENLQLALRRIDEFQTRGSNWKIRSVETQHVHVSKYSPLEGSSYIPTPKEISNPKMGLLNMQNTNDSFCFRWSHVRFLRPSTSHPTRITKEDTVMAATLDYKDIVFPVSIDQIPKIECKNSININVIGYKSKKIFYPLRLSKSQHELTMNLLLIDDNSGNNHYILIKDINRLLHSATKDPHRKHFCLNCSHNFKTEENLQKHREVCLEVNGVQAVRLPPKGTKISFKNHRNTIEAPFVIYADFESSL